MLALQSVCRISWAAVSQFEGVTIDGRPVFVHYRWGWLRAWVGGSGEAPAAAMNGTLAYDDAYGDQHNFDIGWNEVESITGIKCVGTIEDEYQ